MILFLSHLGVFKILSMVFDPKITHKPPKHYKTIRAASLKTTPAVLTFFFFFFIYIQSFLCLVQAYRKIYPLYIKEKFKLYLNILSCYSVS